MNFDEILLTGRVYFIFCLQSLVMTRTYLLSALSLIFLFAACKKKDEGGFGNAFTIGDKSYNVATSTWDKVNRTLIATNVLGNSVFIHFGNQEITSKKYQIADGLSIPQSGEVVVTVLRVADTMSYLSKGLTTLTATIIVNGNNIGAIVPYCDAYNPLATEEVIKISASVQAHNFSQD
jgi:hypothetical protein